MKKECVVYSAEQILTVPQSAGPRGKTSQLTTRTLNSKARKNHNTSISVAQQMEAVSRLQLSPSTLACDLWKPSKHKGGRMLKSRSTLNKP